MSTTCTLLNSANSLKSTDITYQQSLPGLISARVPDCWTNRTQIPWPNSNTQTYNITIAVDDVRNSTLLLLCFMVFECLPGTKLCGARFCELSCALILWTRYSDCSKLRGRKENLDLLVASANRFINRLHLRNDNFLTICKDSKWIR